MLSVKRWEIFTSIVFGVIFRKSSNYSVGIIQVGGVFLGSFIRIEIN